MVYMLLIFFDGFYQFNNAWIMFVKKKKEMYLVKNYFDL